MACGLPLKVSVIWRFSTEPPPVFVTVPDIVYVTVLFGTSGTGFPHAFVALIAQVLVLPRRMALSAALAGLLPDETVANITVLKQGVVPDRIEVTSSPPSWNCNAGTTPPGNPAKPGPLTLNPVPGGGCGN